MSTFGTGTFGDGRFGDPSYEFVAGQYKRIAWKVRWDEGYQGKIGFTVPELENMRYAAPQMEQGELPTAFALNPDDLLPGRVEGGGGLGHIATRTIIAEDIQADTITGNEIKAQSITATELDVGHLSAITANMGEITAGLITLDGGEVDVGGLIQSSEEHPKVILDDRGLIKTSDDASVSLSMGPGESLKFGDPLIDASTSTTIDSFTAGDSTLTGNTSDLGPVWEAESVWGLSSLSVDTSGTGWAYHTATFSSQAANELSLNSIDTSQGVVLHAKLGARSLSVLTGQSVSFTLTLNLRDTSGNYVNYGVSGIRSRTAVSESSYVDSAAIIVGTENIPLGETFPDDLEMIAMLPAGGGLPKQVIQHGSTSIQMTPTVSPSGMPNLNDPLKLTLRVLLLPSAGGTPQSVGFDEVSVIEFEENLDRSILWESSSTGGHTAGIIAQHTEDSTGLLPPATSLDLISYGPDATSPASTLSLDVFSEDAAATVKVGEHSRLLLASDGSSGFQESIPFLGSLQLPTAPKHGQRCTFTFIDYLGQPYAWDLVWNQYAHDFDGNGWVCVGGQGLYAERTNNVSFTNDTGGWVEGPDFGRPYFPGIPRPGIYKLVHSDFIDMKAGAIDCYRRMKVGSIGTAVGAPVRAISDLGARVGTSAAKETFVSLAFTNPLISEYRVISSGDGVTWGNRTSTLTPVRLAT